MKNRSIVVMGYIVCSCHLIVLLLYFWTLLSNPNGAPVIISLILGGPFLLLTGAGYWMVGRIRWIPSLYLLVSGIVLALIYWKSYILLMSPFSSISLVVGMIAVLLTVIDSVLALSVRCYYSAQKYLMIGALVALGLLCLAAFIFLFLYSLIILPNGSVSSLPISFHLTVGV